MKKIYITNANKIACYAAMIYNILRHGHNRIYATLRSCVGVVKDDLE
jgi:hypothetical protein